MTAPCHQHRKHYPSIYISPLLAMKALKRVLLVQGWRPHDHHDDEGQDLGQHAPDGKGDGR